MVEPLMPIPMLPSKLRCTLWQVLPLLLMMAMDLRGSEVEVVPPEVKLPEQVTVLSAIESYGFIRQNPGVNIVDVREPWEVKERGYVEGASQLSFLHQTFKDHFKMAVLRENQPILIYCALGERARRAAVIVVELGYKDVQIMEGGLRSWMKAGLPVKK